MNKNVRLSFSSSSNGKLPVSSVHRVSSLFPPQNVQGQTSRQSASGNRGRRSLYLESDDLPPSQLGEVGPQLSRSEPQSDVVQVQSGLDGLNFPADVKLLGLFSKVPNGRVSNIVRAQNLFSLERLVVRVDVIDRQDGKHVVVSGVSEVDSSSGSKGKSLDVLLGHIEGDGHGEESSRGKSERVSDARNKAGCQPDGREQRGMADKPLVVLLVHETVQRREPSVHDQLQITKMSLKERVTGKLRRQAEEEK